MPSAISVKSLYNFIEIPLRHGCSPVNLPHTFGTAFLKNTSGGLLLDINIHVFNKRIKFNNWKITKYDNCPEHEN